MWIDKEKLDYFFKKGGYDFENKIRLIKFIYGINGFNAISKDIKIQAIKIIDSFEVVDILMVYNLNKMNRTSWELHKYYQMFNEVGINVFWFKNIKLKDNYWFLKISFLNNDINYWGDFNFENFKNFNENINKLYCYYYKK